MRVMVGSLVWSACVTCDERSFPTRHRRLARAEENVCHLISLGERDRSRTTCRDPAVDREVLAVHEPCGVAQEPRADGRHVLWMRRCLSGCQLERAAVNTGSSSLA